MRWVLLLALYQTATAEAPITFGPPVLVAQMVDQEISEASGMAVSQRVEGRYWLVNDSRNPPRLFAVDRRGNTLANAAIEDIENVDWEALEAFTLDGQPWLMIADIGDNDAVRPHVSLFFIREPAQLPVDVVTIERRLDFRLPSGAADLESVFVDTTERSIYLLTKREQPPRLCRVPLVADPGEVVEAELLGEVTTIPPPGADDLAEDPEWGRYRSQATDMAISPDRRLLAVLTYKAAYVWQRQVDEPWAPVLQRAPQTLALPRLVQPEAIAFTVDGRGLLLTSEKWPAPLIEIAIEAP